jgi:hypothetical protein
MACRLSLIVIIFPKVGPLPGPSRSGRWFCKSRSRVRITGLHDGQFAHARHAEIARRVILTRPDAFRFSAMSLDFFQKSEDDPHRPAAA